MVEPGDNDELKDSKKDETTPPPVERGEAMNADGEAPPEAEEAPRLPRLGGRRKGQALTRKSEDRERRPLSAKDRLYLLDAWVKSKLSAGDFGRSTTESISSCGSRSGRKALSGSTAICVGRTPSSPGEIRASFTGFRSPPRSASRRFSIVRCWRECWDLPARAS